MASQTVNTASFGRTADPQLSSAFFSLLPAEIRNLIYAEFWSLCCTRQHVVKDSILDGQAEGGFKDLWSHVPCCTDPDAEDVRFDKSTAADPASQERTLWSRRLKSQWCLHWACEEQGQDITELAMQMTRQSLREHGEYRRNPMAPSKSNPPGRAVPHGPPTQTGFMSVLTTCKRMYLEALPSLYAHTTFIFTDTRTAGEFLSRYGGDDAANRHPIRSLELCFRIPNLLTEVYYPSTPVRNTNPIGGDEGPPATFAGLARPTLTASNNPWQRLCDELAALPNLQELRIWLDSGDLRPWHKRVSETRFCGRLFDVRVPDKRRFLLGLPELPERRGPDSHALEGQYLEGEEMLVRAPFTLTRGPRPNNWRVHLRNIVSHVREL